MRVVTGQEMARLDGLSINAGLPAAALMESAGAAAAVVAQDMCGGALIDRRIHILCGTGNNGGDGFVLARRLHNAGARVRVHLIGEVTNLSGDAGRFGRVLSDMGCAPVPVKQVNEPFRLMLGMGDLVVDAMLGTGGKGAPRGLLAEVIQAVNGCGRSVLSLDIPSGVSADTGRVEGIAVRATQTITFGLLKLGLLLTPGADYCGKVTVADIGFPRNRLAWHDNTMPERYLLNDAVLAPWQPLRRRNAHKGSFGRVLLVAGSAGMLGAGALAARATLRGGAGLVSWAGPSSLWPVMAGMALEATTLGLPESEPGALGESAALAVMKYLEDYTTLAVGPGLGRREETLAGVRSIVRRATVPTVIDADGLYALVGHDAAALGRTGVTPWVLTPHPGEAAALLGCPVAKVESDRPAALAALTEKYQCVVVLKGVPTLVAGSGGTPIYINSSGNPGMATAGMGDVLTGLVAALLAQGLAALPAAAAAVYLHGLAGDMAAESGMAGLVAADVMAALPQALAKCWEKCGGAVY